ncbi:MULTISPECIES: nitrate reductase [unclassified Hyphomonas]|uniref:nitrate reductase n=1 Tax=unclassified Hyphomonas TaxID=2630699 RepID=UPI00068C106A
MPRPPADAVQTTCPYCGVGCGVLATASEGGGPVAVEGDPGHPSNYGKLCSKGTSLGDTMSLSERVLFPKIAGRRAEWGDAIRSVAKGFADTISQYGPESVALYVSGQILTEDYYVANKFAKGFLGTANIDTNSRLCMASSVAGHKRAFGADTVPGCYEDLEEADLVVITGSNFAWCHPVLHQRLLAAKSRRGTKLVVIDPRETATTEAADLHLRIRPGSDVALFNGLLRHLARSGDRDTRFIDQHTTGAEGALEAAETCTLHHVSGITGVAPDVLEQFYRLFAETRRTMTIYSQGVNQSSAGADKVNAILNAHLFTGRIGQPGMGPFSITGQPNAMGGREVGGLANQLAAHMDFDEESIERVGRFWQAPSIASSPGLKAVDMFDAVADGRIKAIWIMATNPVVSLPDADKVRRALEACPLVVVSEVSSTSDTAALADILLPATGWGEKSGTVTNSERRISRQRSFLKPPGEARHDWQAICQVACEMGFDGFEFAGPDEIFREHAQLSGFENDGRRDFDLGGAGSLSRADYDALEPFQWPLPKDAPARPAHHRFFADGRFYTPDHKARFLPVTYRPPASACSAEFPLALNTGRIRDQWHTMTRTGKAARLVNHIAEPFVEVHPGTASACGLGAFGIAKIVSPAGAAKLRVLCTERVSPGEVFVPMHWTDRFTGNGRIDALVLPNTDPVSGQPESKFTPVRLKPLDLDWQGFAVFRNEPHRAMLAQAEYWALAPADGGWRLEVAGCGNAGDFIRPLLPDGEQVTIEYGSNQFASAVFDEAGRLVFACFLDTGPVAADRAWLCGQLSQVVAGPARQALLAGRSGSGEAAGRIVCACMGVGTGKIREAVEAGAMTAEQIGTATGAGTNCGSCKPEIRKLIEGMRADIGNTRQVAAE